jgi:hypothetical protein
MLWLRVASKRALGQHGLDLWVIIFILPGIYNIILLEMLHQVTHQNQSFYNTTGICPYRATLSLKTLVDFNNCISKLYSTLKADDTPSHNSSASWKAFDMEESIERPNLYKSLCDIIHNRFIVEEAS